jgi:hypothetical protein
MALFGAALAMGSTAPAHAACRDTREHRCDDDEDRGNRGDGGGYGAIAYGGRSTAYGYSYGWANRERAERVAMHNCGEHGNDCTIVVTFEHACGAVATNSESMMFGGVGDDEREARERARRQCMANRGRDCEVRVAQCSR